MHLLGTGTFISRKEKEYQGKVYYSANLEIDGDLVSLGTTAGVLDRMERFKSYTLVLNAGFSKNGMYLRLEDIQAEPKAN